jgi:beta-N-acetylhexosaminidase
MREHDAFSQRVRQAAQRVVELKLRYLGGCPKEDLVPDPEDLADRVPDPEGRAAFFDLACRSVSLIRDAHIPLSDEERMGRGVLLVGRYHAFLEEGARRIPDASSVALPSRSLYAGELSELKRAAAAHGTVVFCLSDTTSLGTLKELSQFADRVVVMSALTPVHLRHVAWVRSALAVYGTGAESFRAGFGALLGDFAPEGSVPIEIFGTE